MVYAVQLQVTIKEDWWLDGLSQLFGLYSIIFMLAASILKQINKV